ncbi:A/G-specific adenine glycosylase [Flavobacterium sp. Fl-77]|uniref:Adenine DNA glycosylase n=1 Tax=Flavobacterium flavipigmentatum TaxID=2893884 RepID=A0AAJ2VXA4_9FLAO|nr:MULTISPECIES: A/G-specific adenine glycosylase [unclassified Flavobacterium]MDX6181407.1 A/G-specific adenine glycosylase [Flavobacterium sp. Fl-33]MDX6185009.1 A/G-specific adenine glycosylase [Flavobacterium sp. Fl-77]UFH40100.1 A/G-specific adenine glycosylase [Flavobacterium sp. F-70]
MKFHNLLTDWYLKTKRDLPWRNTTNPYAIWLSEIMLQQTRVAQGTPYFLTFTKEFPTVFDLANADEEKVLKLWQGLGYYSRARNLYKTAQHVAHDLKGVFPPTYNELLKLKGVGEYTAAAIASFAYNEAVPVVDGNVFRVLSRYFDIESDISLPATKKEFTALAHELMPKDNPAIFNQAIMEFGALQCVPKNPDCTTCVFNTSCAALQKKKVNVLPFKSKKLKVTNRFFNYLILEDILGNTLIQKRTAKGIWHNLYEFPLLETSTIADFEFVSNAVQNDFFGQYTIISIEECSDATVLHKLSHQHLHIQFWKIKIKEQIENGINQTNLKTFPFPIVIYNFIDKKELNY